MLPRTPKHDFLAELHQLIRPERYLEIGVQTGTSLSCALPETRCLGVDPHPMLDGHGIPPDNVTLFTGTSDDFFGRYTRADFGYAPFDFTFIDGSHLVEDALRDFIGAEGLSHPRGVIAFDDVIPYSDAIAHRVPLPGDWAGDVWKLRPILGHLRPDLALTLVDVAPTGLMVVQDLDPENGPDLMWEHFQGHVNAWATEMDSSPWLANFRPLKPADALEQIRSFL